jgi:hypothetical protein
MITVRRMDKEVQSEAGDGTGVPRRGFLKGAAGLGLAAGMAGGLADGIFSPGTAYAASDPGITTIPLPTTTAPEQLHLQWGTDPARSVTVSWLAPGTVPQPAPKLSYSTKPITADNPGKVVHLPPPAPLDLAWPRPEAAATSFAADGPTGIFIDRLGPIAW